MNNFENAIWKEDVDEVVNKIAEGEWEGEACIRRL
jgi:uncharacterized protein YlzI (FlbEa/FlbD family)